MRPALCAVFLAFAAHATGQTPVVDAWNTMGLQEHVGKTITVRGKVLSTGRTSHDGIRFLDFTEDRAAGFVGVILPVAYEGTGDLESYKGKSVSITGPLERYKGRIQIKILDPSQLVTDSPAP